MLRGMLLGKFGDVCEDRRGLRLDRERRHAKDCAMVESGEMLTAVTCSSAAFAAWEKCAGGLAEVAVRECVVTGVGAPALSLCSGSCARSPGRSLLCVSVRSP